MPLEFTPEQTASIYAAAMQSVELLRRGEPVGFIGDWSVVEQANKGHLTTVLAYPCWTTEDLSPLQAAATDPCPTAVQASQPAYNPLTERAVEIDPVQQAGQWVQQWQIVSLTPAEQLEQAELVKGAIVGATQARLDAFAQTRGYDGILSACTYATSSVVNFAAEGQYCVTARDATWAALYQVLAEVQAGTRQPPTGFADVVADLPALNWPQ